MAKSARKSLPLHAVRVVDLSRFLAGPYCGSILADLGAEVIRVEPVDGAEDRGLVPVGCASGGALYLQANRGKASVAIDIRNPEGRAALERLVATADVVITNMPLKALHGMALDHASLKRIRRDIITANISAFGTRGRLSQRTGFDGLGQAMSGSAYLAGSRKTPRRAGCSYVDYGTGLALAVGILAALLQRGSTGEGQEVHASLLATALTFTNGWHIEESVLRVGRRPFGNLSPNSAPSDIYAASDGHIVVQSIGSAMFARWAKLMGRADLLSDPRLSTDAARGRSGRRFSRIMGEWTRRRTVSQAVTILTEHGIPAGPVYSPRQLLDDPLIAESGVFQRVRHPGVSRPVPLAAPIVQFGGLDTSIRGCAPRVGEQTQEVLAGLGLSGAQVEALMRKRVAAAARAAPAARGPRTVQGKHGRAAARARGGVRA